MTWYQTCCAASTSGVTAGLTGLPTRMEKYYKSYRPFAIFEANLISYVILLFISIALHGARGYGATPVSTRPDYLQRNDGLLSDATDGIINASTGEDLIAGLANPAVTFIRMTALAVNVTFAAWNSSPAGLPIILTRNVTVEGDTASYTTIDFNKVQNVLILRGGIQLIIRYVVFLNVGLPNDNTWVPGFDMFLPTPANEPPATFHIGPGALLSLFCLPHSSADTEVLGVPRPPEISGSQKMTLLTYPNNSGCIDSPFMKRCWPSATFMIDVVSVALTSDAVPSSLNYMVWLHNMTIFCERMISEDCLLTQSDFMICYKEALTAYKRQQAGAVGPPSAGGAGASGHQRVLNVSDANELVKGLASQDITLIRLTFPVINVTNAAWISSPAGLPVVVERDVTVEGNATHYTIVDLNKVPNVLILGSGVQLTMRYIYIINTGTTNAGTRDTGFDMFLPTPAGANLSTFHLGPAAILTTFCVPGTYAKKDILGIPRPPEAPGNQTALFGQTTLTETGCVNASSEAYVPFKNRCRTGASFLVDIASYNYANNLANIPLNQIVWLHNLSTFCEVVVNEECLRTSSEPLICYVAALSNYSESQQQYGPKASEDPIQSSTASGPSKNVEVAIIAGVTIGTTALAAVLSILFVQLLKQRRLRAWKADETDQGVNKSNNNSSDGPTFAESSSESGTRCQSRRRIPISVDDKGAADQVADAHKYAGFTVQHGSCAPPGADEDTVMAPVGKSKSAASVLKEAPTSSMTPEDLQLDSMVEESPRKVAMVMADPEPVTPLSPQNAALGLQVRIIKQDANNDTDAVIKGQPPHEPEPVGKDAIGAAVAPNEGCGAEPRADSELGAAPVVELLPVVYGKGTFGRVVEGIFRGERVAVKLLAMNPFNLTSTDVVVSMFAQEIEILGRCEHPNIVKLLAACTEAPQCCLVMELMEMSLEGMLYGSTLPEQTTPLPKVLHIGIAIASALAYLHPTIVHRDLKPANVLLKNASSNCPVVKLSDFGLSRLRLTVASTKHPDAGTPAYMAPECFDLQNRRITDKADMYSLGMVLWEMLAGTRPWEGLNPLLVAVMVSCKKSRPPMHHLSDERCPPKLTRLLKACWETDPARRPAAAEAAKEMAMLLQVLVQQAPAQQAPQGQRLDHSSQGPQLQSAQQQLSFLML